MALQYLKPYNPGGTKTLVSRIHTATATVATGASGVGVGRVFSSDIGFGRLVVIAGGGATDRVSRDFKRVDMATLGNLCVDIVLNVPSLPPASKEERKAYMDQLAASTPDKEMSYILKQITPHFREPDCIIAEEADPTSSSTRYQLRWKDQPPTENAWITLTDLETLAPELLPILTDSSSSEKSSSETEYS